MKIVEEYLDVELNKWAESSKDNPIKYLGVGGLNNFIIPEINDFYNGYEYSRDWQIKAFNLVDFDSFEELKKMSYDTIVNTFAKHDIGLNVITFWIPVIDTKVFLDNKGKMTDKDYSFVTREEVEQAVAEVDGKRKKK